MDMYLSEIDGEWQQCVFMSLEQKYKMQTMTLYRRLPLSSYIYETPGDVFAV